jgi:RimJ/RimL family protein N-acetyltransferase
VRTVLPPADPVIGEVVRLDLLTADDLPALAPLLMDERVYGDGYVMHRRPLTVEDGVAVAADRFLAGQGTADGRGGGRTAYAVRLVADTPLGDAGTIVGTTTLWEADLANESIHIGSTLYGPQWWGTLVNPECKYLLLHKAFDDWGYGRVKIQTDVLNTRSAAAIAKLGARREGVHRRHTRREDGTFRDTVVFAITIDDWPTVRAGLLARLGRS